MFVVAHSAAGYSMSGVVKKYGESCVQKIGFLGFTDAVLSDFEFKKKPSGEFLEWIKTNIVAYDASSKVLGTPIKES